MNSSPEAWVIAESVPKRTLRRHPLAFPWNLAVGEGFLLENAGGSENMDEQ